jgi:hypothetical protein
MNNLPISNLTDQQVLELNRYYDQLPRDIQGQITGRLMSIQVEYAREIQEVVKGT